MAWLTSLPAPVVVSIDQYVEWRENPDDPTKEQYRGRRIERREYRGVTLATAQTATAALNEFNQRNLKTRSISEIGGGGYTVTEILDNPKEDWKDYK